MKLICLFHMVILAAGFEYFAKTVFEEFVKLATNSYADNTSEDSEEFIRNHIKQSVPQVEKHRMKKFEQYDIEINPEGRRLKAIGKEGWNYIIGNPERYNQLQKDLKFKAFYVCVLGEFNNGKTWLINLLSDRVFEFGFDQATKSIGFLLPAGESRIVYCDSPGTSRAVNVEDLNDRLGTDMITEETMIHFSDMLLLVCGPLTTDQQLKHRKYIERVSEVAPDMSTKVIYIVHNWMYFRTMKQVENFIKSDIIDPYGAELRYLKGHTFYSHIDNQTGLVINHFIFAAEGSEAGEFWNKKTLQMLKSIIKNIDQTKARRSFKVIKEFKEELEPLLRETFTTEVKDESSLRNRIESSIIGQVSKVSGDIPSFFDTSVPPSDPYQLIIVEDKMLRLKDRRNLEYFNALEIGGKPVPFYRAPFGIFVSNNTWEVQVQIPSCDWWDSDTFSGIKVHRQGDKLIVEGNILKPDRGKEMLEEEYLFDILSETRIFGYFHLPFELPPCVNRDRCMKDGEIGWFDETDNPNCPWKKSLQRGTLFITAEAKGCKLPKIDEDDFDYDY